jgi:2-polyprenyl-6-methoxyphenol hydroxylase-like FAD-dependent oxidoreductase
MRQVDVIVVGGGLAGSLAAAMAGRAGISTALIDPHREFPEDFRCEKLDQLQVSILQKTGLAGAILPATTLTTEMWIARFGRLVEIRPVPQYGISYQSLVMAARAAVPPPVRFIKGKVDQVELGPERQRVTLHDGEIVEGRLIVLATGLNNNLRESLGIVRREIAHAFSTAVGFDLKPVGRSGFAFPALGYYPERSDDRLAYLSLFPIGEAMRANLFAYRDLRDPWMQRLRDGNAADLFTVMPRLRQFTADCEIAGDIRLRSVDLVVTEKHRRDGIVLVGDAFGTSCPAAGTGTNKVLTDVERLCNVYLPAWLATPGMKSEKIAAFYDDAVKQASDAYSASRAIQVRSLSTETSLSWKLFRLCRFAAQYGRGRLRRGRALVGVPLGDGAA